MRHITGAIIIGLFFVACIVGISISLAQFHWWYPLAFWGGLSTFGGGLFLLVSSTD